MLRRAGLWPALVGAVAVLVLQAAATPQAAYAHAELASSNPGDGASVAALPSAVTLTFTEPVGEPAEVSVTGPDDDNVADGELDVVDDTVEQPVDASAASPGAYTVSYQVTSADGHLISGTVAFTVTGGGAGGSEVATDAVPVADTSDGPSTTLVVVLVAALAFALGLVGLSLSRAVRRLSPTDQAP